MTSTENTWMFFQLQPSASWPQLIRLGGLLDCSLRDTSSHKNALYPVSGSLAGFLLLSDICALPSGLRQCNIPGHQTISLWETPPASQFMAHPVSTWISNCKHSQFSHVSLLSQNTEIWQRWGMKWGTPRAVGETLHLVGHFLRAHSDPSCIKPKSWHHLCRCKLWGLVYVLVVWEYFWEAGNFTRALGPGGYDLYIYMVCICWGSWPFLSLKF